MTKEELWNKYCEKNPSFADEGVLVLNLTRRGLKKLFDTTYDVAHDQGFRNGQAKSEMEKKTAAKSDPFSLFEDLLRKK